MDGAQARVGEEVDDVSLSGFLHREHSASLEPYTVFLALSEFADQALEGQLAKKHLRALLVAADVTDRDGSRLILACCGRYHLFGRDHVLRLGDLLRLGDDG